jgi:predicted RecB family endonuclease
MTPKRSPVHAQGTRGELAMAVAEDLRRLVVVLADAFERETEDGEVLGHILNAKIAAERGLILSERLAALTIEGDTGQRRTH